MSAVTERDWFDVATGVLDRSIFADEDIYREELERIFARAWNFVCHESQVPEPGDFFTNWIGEDEVIAVRGRDGAVRVLLNTCPHRGNKVCRAELGNAKRFMCSYHGWALRPRRRARRHAEGGRLLPGQPRQAGLGDDGGGPGRELPRLRLRDARRHGAAARGLPGLGRAARHRLHGGAGRGGVPGRRAEEPRALQLETRRRQRPRLVPRRRLPRVFPARGAVRRGVPRAHGPDGAARRVRARHLGPGDHRTAVRGVRGAPRRGGAQRLVRRHGGPAPQGVGGGGPRSGRPPGPSGIRTSSRTSGSRRVRRSACVSRGDRSRPNSGGSPTRRRG